MLFIKFKILSFLKANSDFSYDLMSQTEDAWYGKNYPGIGLDGEVFASSVNNETYITSNYLTFDKTFAELTMEEKSTISHRGIAVKELILFLQKQTL